MSIWRLREIRNQAVAPIMAPTQMDPMLSHMTRPVKCTSPVHAPGQGQGTVSWVETVMPCWVNRPQAQQTQVRLQ